VEPAPEPVVEPAPEPVVEPEPDVIEEINLIESLVYIPPQPVISNNIFGQNRKRKGSMRMIM
jgi:phenylalanyl-tRNA synthetase beta subunit